MDRNLWNAETLRLTCFGSAQPEAADRWWRAFAGGQPASSTKKASGEVEVAGGFQGGVLELKINPLQGRTDWLLHHSGVFTELPVSLPTVGPYGDVSQVFIAAALAWLRAVDLGGVTRLAAGAVLLIPFGTQQEAYSLVEQFLTRVKVDAVRTKELHYQINVPMTSSVIPDLEINRILKVNVMRWSVELIGAGVAPREEFFVRLELDLSTPPSLHESLASERLVDLVNELAAQSHSIAERGEP